MEGESVVTSGLTEHKESNNKVREEGFSVYLIVCHGLMLFSAHMDAWWGVRRASDGGGEFRPKPLGPL